MIRVLSGAKEPDEPDRDDSELAICIIVPEEYAAVSMEELNSRRGYIRKMEVQDGNVSIWAMLSTSEYNALSEAVALVTGGRCRIEREGSESN